MPVTRAEIAEHVGCAFGGAPVSRDGLLAAAAASRARPGVVASLERLPSTLFRDLRELWPILPDLPVEPGDQIVADHRVTSAVRSGSVRHPGRAALSGPRAGFASEPPR